MITARLIQSGHCDAATNMAIDEAIFLSYKENISAPTLRFYGWKPAAVSIGCSQNPQNTLDLETCQKQNIAFVRRPTGGGIIFHEHELTYSLVLAEGDLGLSCRVKESFENITSFLITAYQDLGIDACFAKNTSGPRTEDHTVADFCFSRKEEYDILVNGKKLGGNAQKRRRNIILQHGSIPLSFDKAKASKLLKDRHTSGPPDITTFYDVARYKIDETALSDALTKAFNSHFKTTLKLDNLTNEEKILAEELKSSKYADQEWNFHASIAAQARVA
ncbi:MAG: biotin/lipoate A/B protein ligase family protein [Candidatus Omnitrophota bacterium]